MPLLEMKHITKSFAGVYANEDVDLSVEQGEIHALLGENGAGKTTLMNILFGIYKADRGETCFKGEHVEFKSPGEAIARGIGMVHQHFSLVKKMTVLDNVMLGLKGEGMVADRKSARKKLMGLAETYGLLVKPEAPVHTLSVGEQQRVEILKALYRDVSLLILDEPTNGLDPMGIVEIRNVLLRLNREREVTILISSHILSELSTLATRYGFIHQGRLVNEITARELERECQEYLEVVADNTERAAMVLETCLDCRAYEVLPDGVLRVYGFLDQVPLLSQTLAQNGVGLYALTPKGSNLEDYFISVIGGEENA